MTDASGAARDAELGDMFLDGSAAAGDLQDVFAADMTSALGTCDGCGRTTVLARARVYARAPGLVLRCAGCDHVLVRIVRTHDSVVLDLKGLRSLQVARGAQA